MRSFALLPLVVFCISGQPVDAATITPLNGVVNINVSDDFSPLTLTFKGWSDDYLYLHDPHYLTDDWTAEDIANPLFHYDELMKGTNFRYDLGYVGFSINWVATDIMEYDSKCDLCNSPYALDKGAEIFVNAFKKISLYQGVDRAEDKLIPTTFEIEINMKPLEGLLDYGESVRYVLYASGVSQASFVELWYNNGVPYYFWDDQWQWRADLSGFTIFNFQRVAPPPAAPVPAPMSALLLLSALGGAGVWARRRRAVRAA